MFGKKKNQPSGDPQQDPHAQPKKGDDKSKKGGMFGFLKKDKAPKDEDPLADLGAGAAREKEDGDPLAFLGPSDNPDIVIKEITKNVSSDDGKTSKEPVDEELLKTVLDSAISDASSQESSNAAENPAPGSANDDSRENVLPNAAELKNAGGGLMGMMKKKTPDSTLDANAQGVAPEAETLPPAAGEPILVTPPLADEESSGASEPVDDSPLTGEPTLITPEAPTDQNVVDAEGAVSDVVPAPEAGNTVNASQPPEANNQENTAPQEADADGQVVDGETPERNMTSLYQSMGLDETLAPGYDPNAKSDPKFVTDGATEPAEAQPQEGKKQSLVSAIVQRTKQSQAEQNDTVLGEDFAEKANKEEEDRQMQVKAKKRERMLLASRFVAGVSLIVPLFSWIIFNALLSPDSSLSSVLNARNYGAELAGVQAKKAEKDNALKKINSEISNYQQETENIKDNKTLKQVIEHRIDFLEIMLRINKITLKALNLTPELNNAIRMLVFNSYSGRMDGDAVQVSITGSVRDPKRLSISKLTQLIEAINADEFFEGAALRSFSKSDDDEGGSVSSFSLSFAYYPDADKALNDSIARTAK